MSIEGRSSCPGLELPRARGSPGACSMSPRYLLRSQLLGGLWKTCQANPGFSTPCGQPVDFEFFARAVIVRLDFCYR